MTGRRIIVLLNDGSGSVGEDCPEALRSAFAKQGISAIVEVSSGSGLRSAAEQALQMARSGECDAVVVGGGDGSIGTVAGVLAGTDIPLGIIPLGTRNHFAKDLQLPLSIDDAIAVIASGETRSVDAADVNGQIFVNNSSVGLYPYLVLDRERRRRRTRVTKWLATILAGMRAVRYFRLPRLAIRTDADAAPVRTPYVFVGNNEYCLTGPALGSRERMNDGRLCVFVGRQQSVLAIFWLACRCFVGLLDQPRDLKALSVAAVDIEARRRKVLVAFDGELKRMRSPLRYRIRPGALRVFTPR